MLALSLQWIDFWRRAAMLGWRNADQLAALPGHRQLRDWWLADMRRLTSEYTKSPAFLAMMRFNLTLLTHPMMQKTLDKTAQMMPFTVR
jgi:hypothetical protein